MKTSSVFKATLKRNGTNFTSKLNKATNNIIASKRILDLSRQTCIRKNDTKLIRDAFKIYGQIKETPNHLPINAMLGLFIATNQHHQVTKCWNDIDSLLRNEPHGLSLNALMDCLSASKETAKCLAILNVMKERELSPSELSDSVLIQMVNASNLGELRSIKQWIEWRAPNLPTNHGVDYPVECALMRALVDRRGNTEALELYDAMTSHHKWECADPRAIGICSNLAIKACSNGLLFEKGQEIHDALRRSNGLNVQIKHSLIMFYAKCNDIDSVRSLFASIPEAERDTVTLNVMLSAYSANNQHQNALDLYRSTAMHKNERSHVLAIRASQHCNDHEAGKAIHAQIGGGGGRSGSRQSVQLKHALMAFYGHFGDVLSAEAAFGSIAPQQMDRLSVWTMIRLYAQHNGRGPEHRVDRRILALYDRWPRLLDDDDFVHLLALKCCSNLGDFQRAQSIMAQRIVLRESTSIQLQNKMIEIEGALHRVAAAKEKFR